MRLSSEGMRRILMEIESLPYGKTVTVSELQILLNDYSIEEVISMVTVLNRERYIMVLDKSGYDDNDVFRDNRIKCLTEKGSRNLDIIRDDKLWNLMKEKISNFNELSFFTITSTANKIINSEYNKIFNLDSSSFIDYTRW